ncbi:MAG: hypothetical protein NXI30_14865 [bacterium]|nr:hypothetical protein [bacterium]
MRLVRLFVPVLLVTVAATLSSADPLADRNLPPGKHLYTDSSGTYFGLYTTRYLGPPSGPGIDEYDIVFHIVAVRNPAPDGTLVRAMPARIQDDYGKEHDGFQVAASETKRMNEHLMPAVDRLFSERRFGDFVTMIVYATGEHYSNGQPSSRSGDPDLEEPEQPVTRLTFSRENANAPVRPAYGQKATGIPAQWFRRGTQDLHASRKRLPDSIAPRRRAHAAGASARYVRDAQGDVTGINNPDGMFFLSESGRVHRIELFRPRDDDGSYAIDVHDVEDGEKLLDGWWYPQHQQFWAQERVTMPGNEHCNQMSPHRWTYVFARTPRQIGGRTIDVFAETQRFDGDREPKVCEIGRLDTQTCRVERCKKYVKLPPRISIVATLAEAELLSASLRAE